MTPFPTFVHRRHIVHKFFINEGSTVESGNSVFFRKFDWPVRAFRSGHVQPEQKLGPEYC